MPKITVQHSLTNQQATVDWPGSKPPTQDEADELVYQYYQNKQKSPPTFPEVNSPYHTLEEKIGSYIPDVAIKPLQSLQKNVIEPLTSPLAPEMKNPGIIGGAYNRFIRPLTAPAYAPLLFAGPEMGALTKAGSLLPRALGATVAASSIPSITQIPKVVRAFQGEKGGATPEEAGNILAGASMVPLGAAGALYKPIPRTVEATSITKGVPLTPLTPPVVKGEAVIPPEAITYDYPFRNEPIPVSPNLRVLPQLPAPGETTPTSYGPTTQYNMPEVKPPVEEPLPFKQSNMEYPQVLPPTQEPTPMNLREQGIITPEEKGQITGLPQHPLPEESPIIQPTEIGGKAPIDLSSLDTLEEKLNETQLAKSQEEIETNKEENKGITTNKEEAREYYKKRLINQELVDKGITVDSGLEDNIAIPTGGNRVSGSIFVTPENAETVINQLKGKEGFDNVRFNKSNNSIEWGDKITPGRAGEQYGYKPEEIENFQKEIATSKEENKGITTGGEKIEENPYKNLTDEKITDLLGKRFISDKARRLLEEELNGRTQQQEIPAEITKPTEEISKEPTERRGINRPETTPAAFEDFLGRQGLTRDDFSALSNDKKAEILGDFSRSGLQSVTGTLPKTSPQEIVKNAGGIYRGIQQGIGPIKDQILFDDPKTGTTMAIDSDSITPENIKNKIDQSRAKYSEFPEVKAPGEKVTEQLTDYERSMEATDPNDPTTYRPAIRQGLLNKIDPDNILEDLMDNGLDEQTAKKTLRREIIKYKAEKGAAGPELDSELNKWINQYDKTLKEDEELKVKGATPFAGKFKKTFKELRDSQVPAAQNVADTIIKAEDKKTEWKNNFMNDMTENVIKPLKTSELKDLNNLLRGEEGNYSQKIYKSADNFHEIMEETLDKIREIEKEKNIGLAPGNKTMGEIEDYYSWIEKQLSFDPNMLKSWQTTKDYFLSKDSKLGRFISGFKREDIPIGEGTKEEQVYDTSLGKPESRFTKTRPKGFEGTLEDDPRKVILSYAEGISRAMFDKPAVLEARESLKNIPDSVLKERAEDFVRNYTGFTTTPLERASVSGVTSPIMRAGTNMFIRGNPTIQALHLSKLANLWYKMPSEAFNAGIKEFLSNPRKAFREAQLKGLGPGEYVPRELRAAYKITGKVGEWIDDFGYAFSAADTGLDSIGYKGYKNYYIKQGMSEEQANLKAIDMTKTYTFKNSAARVAPIFYKDFQGVLKPAAMWHQTGVDVANQYINDLQDLIGKERTEMTGKDKLIMLSKMVAATAMAAPAILHAGKRIADWGIGAYSPIANISSKIVNGKLNEASEDLAVYLSAFVSPIVPMTRRAIRVINPPEKKSKNIGDINLNLYPQVSAP